MKKAKRPSFEELIDRFANSIEKREGKKINEQAKIFLASRWKGHDELLYQAVKKAEQNERKAIAIIEKTEVRKVEFNVGFSISGQPIIVTHLVEFVSETKDPKRYKKQGSDFCQKLKREASFQNILF